MHDHHNGFKIIFKKNLFTYCGVNNVNLEELHNVLPDFKTKMP